MKLELGELNIINSNNSDVIEDLSKLKLELNDTLSEVSDNIDSTTLKNSTEILKNDIERILLTVNKNLNKINIFFKEQLKSYSVTMEEANQKINNLVKIIELCIDENGNISDENYQKIHFLINSSLNVDDASLLYDIYSKSADASVQAKWGIGNYLYEKLGLASKGYSSAAEYVNDVLADTKSMASSPREEAVYSVMALVNITAENGVRIPYNLNCNRGTPLTVDNMFNTGVDCSAFTSWAVQQGATKELATGTTGTLINAGIETDAMSVQPGDIAVYHNPTIQYTAEGTPYYDGHVVFILENNPATGTMIIAESGGKVGNGVGISTMTYEEFSNRGYQFRDMSEYYCETDIV